MVGYLLGPWLVRGIQAGSRWISGTVQGIPTADLLAGAVGLLIGLILALLITLPLPDQIPLVGPYLPLAITAILGYTGWTVGVKKREELVQFFRLPAGTERGRARRFRSGTRKILDTSVIIDGRIADICATGFLEGPLVVPRFVLEELQHIADSSDVLKRNRGRRGLDILNRIQKEPYCTVRIVEDTYSDLSEVDAKLVRLAKDINGKVVTNDFNLNKVCELHGVPVLNINELANSVKPVVLPGEELKVHV